MKRLTLACQCLSAIILLYVIYYVYSDCKLDILYKLINKSGYDYEKIHDTDSKDDIHIEIIENFFSGLNTKRICDYDMQIYGHRNSWMDEVPRDITDTSTETESEPYTETNTETNTESSTEPSTDIVPEGDSLDKPASNLPIYVPMPSPIGVTYSHEELAKSNFIINNFFTVPSSTKLYNSDVNIDNIMSIDMTMKQDNSKPQILIYHTHSMECFADSEYGNKSQSIVKVGEYLAQILREQFGYNVIHCTDRFDYVNGVENRTGAYERAYTTLNSILTNNKSIEVVLDIHRDGVDDNVHLVSTVNNKKTAKVMFFNGLSRNSSGKDISYYYNKYRQDNLAMSLQMKIMADNYYPGFTRKNYVNAYHYNMNLRAKSMLIEVGAQTNSLSEALNAAEPLAALLNMLLQ